VHCLPAISKAEAAHAGYRSDIRLILLSHKNPTWGIFLYINHKV
jgi:hypothetical protein